MPKADKDPNLKTFVRDVVLITSSKDAEMLDGQSKICNRLHNELRDEVGACMAELNLIRGYNLSDDPVIKALGFTETYEKTDKKTKEKKQVTAVVTREQQLLRQVYSDHGLRDLVPGIKAKHPFFKAVHASPLKNVALRLTKAIKNHRDSVSGKRKGPKVGWPKYKSWKKDWYSIEYEEKTGWSIEDGGFLKLKFGSDGQGGKHYSLRLQLQNPPKGLTKAKALRIVKEHGIYRAIFTMERVIKPKLVAKVEAARTEMTEGLRVAYIDPNMKNLGHLVDTNGLSIEFENTDGIRKLDYQIDKIKSKRDRCKRQARLVTFQRDDLSEHRHWEPSKRWKRLDKTLKREEQMRRDLIKQHLYAVGHVLFQHYDVVGIGDFAPANADSGMERRANRTIRSLRYLTKLRETLSWLAVKSGREFYIRDERGTTRTCSSCKFVVEGGIHPSIREWSCTSCDVVHSRDENASQNGLIQLIDSLREDGLIGNLHVPCSGPVPIRTRCRMSFRSGGRWKVEPYTITGSNASMNSIVASESTEAVGGSLTSFRRGSQRPKLAEFA